MIPIISLWKIPVIFLANLLAIGLIIYVGIEFIAISSSLSYGAYIFYICAILLLQFAFNTLVFYHIQYKADRTLISALKDSGLYGVISFLIADTILVLLTFFN
jgi:hypothetical protein